MDSCLFQGHLRKVKHRQPLSESNDKHYAKPVHSDVTRINVIFFQILLQYCYGFGFGN